MDKARVLKSYEVDEPTYQDICSVLGLENPSTLSESYLGDFDKIHEWLKNNEVKSFSEARKRYQAEAKAASTVRNGIDLDSPELKSAIAETAEGQADYTLENGLELLSHTDQHIQRLLLKPYLEAIYRQAKSPEFQEKYRKACEGEKVADGDFFYPDDEVAKPTDGYSGLSSLASLVLHQQLMIFCHSHRAVLQSRADSLKIRERQLMQQLHYKEQTAKAILRLGQNLFVVIGALGAAMALGAMAGFNYPPAIACAKGDALCSLRFRAGIVLLNK